MTLVANCFYNYDAQKVLFPYQIYNYYISYSTNYLIYYEICPVFKKGLKKPGLIQKLWLVKNAEGWLL
jgi:hypothetical protein